MVAPFTPLPALSIAGIIKLKEVAANITPAAKPSKQSSNLRETLVFIKTGKAPSPVNIPVPKLQIIPTKIMLNRDKNWTKSIPSVNIN